MKTISAVRSIARQALRDEYKATGYEFPDDELDLYIGEALIEISQARPYEVRETVTADGTNEIDLSEIDGLLEVVKVEWPTGNIPPSFLKFHVFGGTIRLDVKPTEDDDIYVYCHKVHEVTDSSSSLDATMEKVLVEGVVAKAAQAFLNKMRDQIVPSSARWYNEWANNHLLLYRAGLNSITRPKAWEY